ncbi:helix-turn-helix domain-containing protein [Gemmatimonas sp.]|uniref:helix-turn-helix domain-containing protein n=1 Tax=Gemmatimonas sp. TaxID=1962908 RepID=UPI003DA3B29C
MRLRLPELLHARGLTAYKLAALSGGRISESTAYRLVDADGRLQTYGAQILDALCEVLEVEPGDLFERETVRPPRGSAAPAAKSSKAATRGRAR